MLTWSIWTSCPQLPPASFSRARLARPIASTEYNVFDVNAEVLIVPTHLSLDITTICIYFTSYV